MNFAPGRTGERHHRSGARRSLTYERTSRHPA